MVTTLQECELYTALSKWLTSTQNGQPFSYRVLVDFPAFGHVTLDNKIEWRIAPPQLPTAQNFIDAYNAHLDEQVQQNITAQVEAGAITQASAIPSWAGWTESDVLNWFDTNVTNLLPAANLAAANTIMTNMATAQRAMARMLIALRNKTWPSLQD